MITNKDLRIEIANIEKTMKKCNEYEQAMLKSQTLIIKLLANMRTNQALALSGSGIDLIPRRISDENQT